MPNADDPATGDPVTDGPVTDGPVTDGPVADDPVAEEPSGDELPVPPSPRASTSESTGGSTGGCSVDLKEPGAAQAAMKRNKKTEADRGLIYHLTAVFPQ